MHVYNSEIMLYLYLLLTLTHSDVGKPVQLDISLACSHCFRVFITTIQGLLVIKTDSSLISQSPYHVLILEHFI